MKGYKVFNPDWTCRGFQFEVGKVFEKKRKPKICKYGFHFCKNLIDCFTYYSFSSDNKVAEIEAVGDIDAYEDETKHCTNKIRIIRELTWREVLDMVNLGKNCTGNRNTGDYNTGSFNACDYNTGKYNRSGCHNTGSFNAGYYNAGNYNVGDHNTGSFNKGSYNVGDWNNTSHSNGCFNTEKQKILLFNKPSDWTIQDWIVSEARHILLNCPSNRLIWVSANKMTNEEKEQHPEYIKTGGFLRYINEESERQLWWDKLSDQEKKIILEIPNFDKDIFKEITGIDVGL